MQFVLLITHIIITLLLITVILIQPSQADGLSGLGGSNTNLLSGRSTANFLTRLTAILATLFMVNCLVLSNMAARQAANEQKPSLINTLLPTEEKSSSEHTTGSFEPGDTPPAVKK